ncbi:MAG: NAD(P)H-dependent oxidoreductase [Clostridia bacterium]|nr:NAD(P)H-dependent oxidoreductase [Clostridia bacterium]
MKILVINGSPKGENSITLQTVLYLEKLHPEHDFSFLNVGAEIRKLEKEFTPAKEAMENAELILFSYPVYTFTVPSQLHRFIELTKESGAVLSGKYTSQISTSKHFYDVTAHRFILDNCQDLGMRCVRGLSADMEDLLTEKGRKEAETYFNLLIWNIEHQMFEKGLPRTVKAKHRPTSMAEETEKTGQEKIVIVVDCAEGDQPLKDMIARFRSVLPIQSVLVNIRQFEFKGGCLGCFQCASDGICVYKDGFDRLLREKIQTAQGIVLAFSIRDHSMGSVFKMYDDRQFCNGHRTVTEGTPFGYLISGDYMAEENLRMVIEARAEAGGNYLAGVATDETDPDREIDQLAEKLTYAVREKITLPRNFYGVGGMKIFRDLIWTMQGLMKADHQYYRQHGVYDFPQKKRGTMLKMYLVGALMASKPLRSKMRGKMNEGMLAPYKKVIRELETKTKHD